MIFTSITFVCFFLTVFFLYWFVFSRNLKLQNIFLLAASYLFYGWWDWRFLFFLIEWTGRKQQYAIEAIGLKWPLILRWSFYSFILFLIGMFMSTNESPFIYFQF